MNLAAPESRSVAIVGGGMLGIALARCLAAAGRTVTIFEAAPQVGGLTAPATTGELTWDAYYHVTLASDTATRELLTAAGLGSELQVRATSTGYWDGRVVRPAASVRDFLALPGIGPIAKLRVGATIAVNARRRDWRRIERVAVADWLRAWSGRRAFERFWLPQLRAKLGDDHDGVAASLLWATFRRLDGARRGAGRREQMGYVRGGYARVVPAVATLLEGVGVDVRAGVKVTGIRAIDAGAEVGVGGSWQRFDDVVVTLAAPLAADLVDVVDPTAARSLRAVRTMGVICASVVFDRPVSSHYLTYLAAPSPLTAVVDMSALVDADEFGGRGLVYLPRYLPSDHPDFGVSDTDLEARWLPALRAVYPDAGEVRACSIARARHVFAVPSVGYSTSVPPLTTAYPSVHVVSSAHLVHATLNVDETLALGSWAGGQLLATGRIDRDALLSRG